MKKKVYDQMLSLITQMQEGLTDKSKHGTKLSVFETGMLLEANNILNQIKC